MCGARVRAMYDDVRFVRTVCRVCRATRPCYLCRGCLCALYCSEHCASEDWLNGPHAAVCGPAALSAAKSAAAARYFAPRVAPPAPGRKALMWVYDVAPYLALLGTPVDVPPLAHARAPWPCVSLCALDSVLRPPCQARSRHLVARGPRRFRTLLATPDGARTPSMHRLGAAAAAATVPPSSPPPPAAAPRLDEATLTRLQLHALAVRDHYVLTCVFAAQEVLRLRLRRR